MSRSTKKHPFNGITTTKSEKQDKRIANKRLRLKAKQQIKNMVDPDADVFPVINEVSDVWVFGKDGKFRFDPDEYKKLMRK